VSPLRNNAQKLHKNVQKMRSAGQQSVR